MIKFKWFYKSNSDEVVKRTKRANFRNLGHAAASLRRASMRRIRRGKQAAPPGQAPRTRRGAMRRAILFDVNRTGTEAVIGPAFSMFGKAASAHEFGGLYMGQTYPIRPTMGPALEEQASRLAPHWKGSI